MRHLLAAFLLLPGLALAQSTRPLTGADVLYSLTHPGLTVLPPSVLPNGGVGPAGTPGAAGLPGTPGIPGVSISGATLDSAGRLVLQRSDGTSLAPVALPSGGAPPASGGTTSQPATTYVAQTSALPNVLYQLDAAMSASPAAPVAGTPHMQVEAGTNYVLSVSLPDGTIMQHGYGAALFVADGWSSGRPVIRDTAAQFNSGYDALIVPNGVAGRVVQSGQSSDRWFVIKQTAHSTTELFRTLIGSNGIKVFGAPGATDCALHIEVNLGSAAGTEPSGPLTACGQKQIIEVVSDQSTGTVSIIRNGTLTLTTTGGQVSGWVPDNAELLNSCNCDLAWHEQTLGIGTLAQRQQELTRLTSVYSVSGVSALTFAPAAQAPVAVDLQSDFLTSVNIPKAGGNGIPLPLSASITLPTGLSFEPGATQVFGAIFGTGANANIKTTQDVYDTFFTTVMEGNLDQAIGSPMDTGQGGNNVFNTVLRTYPPSSPNNQHVVAPDGLHLRAACSANRTNCGPGAIYGAGVVLSQVPIRPGMTVKMRRKTPKGDHSWAPAWLFSINQGIPPTGTTSLFSDAAKAVMHNCGQASVNGSGKCQEIDMDDSFSRFGNGTATGKQIIFGSPDIYGAAWERGKFPHFTYGANGGGYVSHLGAGPDYFEMPFDQSAVMSDLVFEWRPDNTTNLFVNDKLVATGYHDFTKSVAYMEGGVLKYVGMQLMLMNQAVPGFSPGASSVTDNDGLGVDGWAPVYEQVAIWQGNIANPQNFLANPTNAYAGNTGDPVIDPARTWVVSNTRVIQPDNTLATKVANPDGSTVQTSLILVGLSTSSTVPPANKGGPAGPATDYGSTEYFNNGSGDWISFRFGVVKNLAPGTYYFWVQTPDGVDHLASPTPYVK